MPKRAASSASKKTVKKSRPSSRAPRAKKEGLHFLTNPKKSIFGRAVPQTLTATHRYASGTYHTATGAATTLQVFKCNGLYDPDTTNIGHQPYLFDQISALYNHWTVVRSRITITFNNFRPAGGPDTYEHRLQCALFVDDDATFTGGLSAALELGNNCSWGVITGNDTGKTLHSKWSLKDNFGITKPLGMSRFQGDSSNDPTELSQFILLVQNSSAATEYIDYVAVIEYDVIWSEPKDVAQS